MIGILLCTLSLAPTVVQVRPGNDLQAAIDSVKNQPNARVIIHGGEYLLSKPITIGKQSEGLTIEAEKGAKPLLIGGVKITGWRKVANLLEADVPETVATEGARMLKIGNELRPRARVPATGELTHLSVFDVPWMSSTGGGWKRKPTDVELTTLKYKPEDVGPWLDPASAEVTVYHMWDESCVGIASVDESTHTIKFSSPCGHPPGAFDVHKYVIWNTRNGLNEPGQWFLDRRAKKLLYWPRKGETPATLVAYLPVVSTLIDLQGAPKVTIRGLSLSVSNVPLAMGGFGTLNYKGAINAGNCPGLKVEDVTASALAGWGISLWNCPDSLISHCTATDCGSGGIRDEGDRSVIADCTVRRIGIQFPSGLGIFTNGKDSLCTHNEVTDTSYSGIVGAGDGERISDNYVTRVMLKLHDGGGIYFGGAGKVTVEGNLVENIFDTGGYGASSYYLDEQAHECVVKDNVSVNVVRPSQNHMARLNAIEGNLFITPKEMHLDFARCTGYVLKNNVLSAGGPIEFKLAPDGADQLVGNTFDALGEVTRIVLNQYAETSRAPLVKGKNSFEGATVKALGKRAWIATFPDGTRRKWDLSAVGPRKR